jgi:hypothetical protein
MSRVRHRNYQLKCEVLESRQLLSGYYIVNAFSGKMLNDPAFSTSNGAVIQQFQPTGGANQRWNLLRQANGNYEVLNAFSGKVLTDPNFSIRNGTPIEQFQRSGSRNQQWKLVALANGN